MSKKFILAGAVLALGFGQVVTAQTNLQIFYDFGRDRHHVTTTLEGFYGDNWGNTFFFIDHDFNGKDANGKVESPSGTYMEIARCFNFWQNTKLGGLSLQAEYNGGVYNGYNIKNAFLTGFDYFLHSKDFRYTFNFKVLYKYIQNTTQKVPMQFTFVWGMQDLFGLKGLRFSGFADIWGENVINFMDGINGITAGYSLAVLIPLLLLSRDLEFIEESFLVVAILGVLVFCIFNFRPKGKAKCFAGDVGSIGIAFIMLFALVRLIFQTGDMTYMILFMVYGIDGVSTAIHRMMLHENLGQAHRKHAYQIMANELKIGHVKVSLLYMVMQLAVSLGFIYLCPNTIAAHWIYGLSCVAIAVIAYVAFMKKYYHLHEEYLASLEARV